MTIIVYLYKSESWNSGTSLQTKDIFDILKPQSFYTQIICESTSNGDKYLSL